MRNGGWGGDNGLSDRYDRETDDIEMLDFKQQTCR